MDLNGATNANRAPALRNMMPHENRTMLWVGPGLTLFLEAGNSPEIIFQHYRELASKDVADGWFGITRTIVKAHHEKEETQRKGKIVDLDKEKAAA